MLTKAGQIADGRRLNSLACRVCYSPRPIPFAFFMKKTFLTLKDFKVAILPDIVDGCAVLELVAKMFAWGSSRPIALVILAVADPVFAFQSNTDSCPLIFPHILDVIAIHHAFFTEYANVDHVRLCRQNGGRPCTLRTGVATAINDASTVSARRASKEVEGNSTNYNKGIKEMLDYAKDKGLLNKKTLDK